MKVLVVNAGSSSLKYQLFDTESKSVMAKGNCERIGIGGSRIIHKTNGKSEYIKNMDLPDHSAATKLVVETLLDGEVGCIKSPSEIEAIGHRVVHGGPYFSESMLATPEVMEILEKCTSYAPLHTPAHIMGIKGCMAVMPDTPEVLVFDTAFHQTMSEPVYMYGISYDMYEEYGIRRYGAHGTSHRYVSAEMIKIMGGEAEGKKIVTCHIGNGSSITAVKDGKCFDTSMGFTPLDGIMMGTRCGAIDPAIVPYIMEKKVVVARLNAVNEQDVYVLSLEEELQLVDSIRQGGKACNASIEKLSQSKLSFITAVANRYVNEGLSMEELLTAGNRGLVLATNNFDEKRGE